MLTAIKENVEVLAGGILQLHSSNLKPHTMVSVSAVLEIKEPSKIKLTDMIGAGKGLFKSVDEVDCFIRNEREEWK